MQDTPIKTHDTKAWDPSTPRQRVAGQWKYLDGLKTVIVRGQAVSLEEFLNSSDALSDDVAKVMSEKIADGPPPETPPETPPEPEPERILMPTLTEHITRYREAHQVAPAGVGGAVLPPTGLHAGGKKNDHGKAPYDLIPPEVLEAIAQVLGYGATAVYAPRNWEKGLRWGRVFAAMMRHLWAWWGGKNIDADSGFSHLWNAATCLSFLIAYEARGMTEWDDRPNPRRLHVKCPPPGKAAIQSGRGVEGA